MSFKIEGMSGLIALWTKLFMVSQIISREIGCLKLELERFLKRDGQIILGLEDGFDPGFDGLVFKGRGVQWPS